MEMLACLCVDHLKKQQEAFDKYIMNTLKSETFQFQTQVILRDLLAHIDKLAPCEAVYPGSFADGNTQPILCTQERICHGQFHRTANRVNLPSCSSSKTTKLVENFQYWVGLGYRPVWAGEHQMNYLRSFDEDLELFQAEIQFLSRVLPTNFFLTRIAIMQKALFYAPDRSRTNAQDLCWICLDNLAARMMDGCTHVFCSVCIDRLENMSDNQVPVQVNPVYEDAIGFVPNIKHNKCPICGKQFARTTNVTSEKALSKIASKFDYIFTMEKPNANSPQATVTTRLL